MPRFFFDVQDGERCIRDEQGIDLPHVNRVWEIAVPMVDDIAKAKGHMQPPQSVSVVVRDASDIVVYQSVYAPPSERDKAMTMPLLTTFAGHEEAKGQQPRARWRSGLPR